MNIFILNLSTNYWDQSLDVSLIEQVSLEQGWTAVASFESNPLQGLWWRLCAKAPREKNPEAKIENQKIRNGDTLSRLDCTKRFGVMQIRCTYMATNE